MSIDCLRERFPWPKEPPDVPPRSHGWFSGRADVFEQFIGPQVNVYLELGSWLGKSVTWFAERCPNATVICIDHWRGSPEHHRKEKWQKHLPTLYETFLTNMWELRDRVIPIRANTLDGMRAVAQADVRPDVIYIDAAHDADSVYHDLVTAIELFPGARILGDDWPIEGVRHGVRKLLAERGEEPRLVISECKTVWYLLEDTCRPTLEASRQAE